MVGYRKTRRAAGPASTERSKSMSAVSNFATLVPGTKTPGSKHREILPFPESLLARWDAGYAGDRSAQSNSHVLTPRRYFGLCRLSCCDVRKPLLRRPLRAHGSPEINTACPPSGGYVEQSLH